MSSAPAPGNGVGLSAPELFAAVARARPGGTAVIESGGRWDYAATGARATRLAWHLRDHLGLSAEDPVAVAATRSRAMVAGVLGVLQAGCAYVPIDPADPAERLHAMIAEAGVRAVVGSPHLRRLAGRLPYVTIGALPDRPGTPPVTIRPASLAYVMFTSGSTGRPKGVAIEHRALSAMLAWSRDFFQVHPGDVFLQFARLTFDVSVWEILTPLTSGAATVLATADDVLSPAAVERLIAEHRVSHLEIPGPVLEAMDLSSLPSLRFCAMGSDRLRPRTVACVAGPGRQAINTYGPTEATYATLVAVCDPRSPSSPPIGTPVAGTTAYILDAELDPAPLGAPGELYLGGAQLARGYLGRPAQTAERFVPDPWGGPGSRLYRTGDLVRRRPDGAIDFIGRRDRQLKVRGVRVELAEAERAIEAAGGVTAAAVITVPHHDGQRMIAHVAGRAEPQALRRHLAQTLPGHLVPSAVVVHDALPHTANGKVDYVRLTALSPHVLASPEPRGNAAPLQRFVYEIVGAWPAPGDTFLDLGGDSLDAIRVVARLREHGLDLDARELLGSTPVAGLRSRPAARQAAVSPVSEAGEPVPLTPGQAAMWYHQLLMPTSTAYHIPMCLELDGPLDTEQLRAAWDLVVQRHEALRSRIVVRGVRTCMIADTAPPPIRVHDLTMLSGHAQRDAIRGIAEQQQPFALTEQAPFRLALLRLSAARHQLAITVHHILCDGWSLAVLVEDFAAAYQTLGRGETAFPDGPAPGFSHFARRQGAQIAAGRFADGVKFWTEALSGLRPAPAWRAGARASQVALGRIFDISGAETGRLRRRFGEIGTTMFAGLLAGFARALADWFGQPDLVIGIVTAGRPDLTSELVIGQFVNTLPLPLSVRPALTMRGLAELARDAAAGSLPYWDVPLPLISAALKPRQARRTGGPWHAIFEFDSAPTAIFDAGPLSGRFSDDGLQQGAVSEISLRVFERRSGLRSVLVGDAGVVGHADLARIARMTSAAWQELAG